MLYTTLVHRNNVPGMPRTSEARIHQKLWPTNGPPIHPLFVRTLYHGGPTLSATAASRKHSQDSCLEGQIDGDLFRYDHVRTPCPMGTVVFSHTGSCPGVLKTVAVIPGNPPVRLGAGGLNGRHGHEPWEGSSDNPPPHRTAKVELRGC